MPSRIHPIRPDDIHPLTDFLRGHREVVQRLAATGRPEVLTVHGKAAVVVQDASAYQRVLELAERMEILLAVQEGLDQMGRGEGLRLDEFERRFREARSLPGRGDAAR